VGELAEAWGFAAQEKAEHQAVRTLRAVRYFYQYYCSYFLLTLLFCLTGFNPAHEFCLFLMILLPIPLGLWNDHMVLCCQLRLNHNKGI